MKKLSWEQIEKVVDELAGKIKASNFQPDYIIGITTGGLIPLYFLAKKLDVENILTVSASSYEKEKQKELKITYLPEIDLSNKKILLVDEITETGTSLEGVSKAIIDKYNVGELKTATLGVNTDTCAFYPDFYVVTERGEWVVFPWEKEDFPEYFPRPQNISLQRATSEDIHIYLSLERSVGAGHAKTYSGITSEKEAQEEIEKNIVYLIKKDDQVVGTIQYQLEGKDCAHITGLVVDPHFQEQGIGREALARVLDELKHIKRIDLVTHPYNTIAVMLYLSSGFGIESWKDNYFGDEEPRIMLSYIKKQEKL